MCIEKIGTRVSTSTRKDHNLWATFVQIIKSEEFSIINLEKDSSIINLEKEKSQI